MKKIYSFMLLAAAMLLSINANAAVAKIGSTTYESLPAAFQAAQESTAEAVTIELVATEAIVLDAPITINTTQSITLDMAGRNILASSSASQIFKLEKGEFIVTSDYPAVLQNSGAGAYGILVSGTYKNPDDNGKYEFDKVYYSHLRIDKNITIKITNIPNDKKGRGIGIDKVVNIFPTKNYASDDATVWHPYNIGHGLANGVKVDVEGDIELTGDPNAKGYGVQVSGNVRYVGEFLKLVGDNNYSIIYAKGKKSQTTPLAGYGAVNHNNKVCYKFYVASEISGTDTTFYYADASWANYAPVINLGHDCKISVPGTSTGIAAMYAAGYATWNISCEAEGATALDAKSGNITITDAILQSTATQYHAAEPVKNEQGKVVSSGVNAQGSAIVVESHQSYAGDIHITIAGDTRIESQAGYAVEEAVTTENTNTKVSAVTIDGGSFVGGNEGCIVFSELTLNPQGEVTTVPITINGGMYEDVDNDNKLATNTLISQIISGGTYTTEIATSNPGTGVAIVITSGNTPDPVDDPTNFNIGKLYELNSASTDPEDWNDIDLSNLPDNTEFTLDVQHGNLTLGDVMMNGMNEGTDPTPKSLTIIVEDGVTFKTKKIIMNKTARIIVKAGGKLIVAGEQGIIATAYENITVEAREGKSGTFLIHPISSSNRHPKATVEFISKAYFAGSDNYLYQRFGIPTFNALNSFTCADGSLSTPVKKADLATDTWQTIGKVQDGIAHLMDEPFACYNMVSNNEYRPEGVKYTMTGELVGNGDAILNTPIKWGSHANSYLADIDMIELIDAMPDDMCKAVYVYKQNTNSNTYRWDAIDKIAAIFPLNSKLPAMQAFILNKRGSAIQGISLDYEAAVFNPAMGIVPNNDAPARRAQMDITAAMISVSNEQGQYDNVIIAQGDQFSAAADNGYDTEKFMNDEFNLYVTADEKMAHFASDNLANTYIGIAASKAGMYTLHLENMIGEGLAIVDLTTGARMDLTQGAEYTFQVAANEANDYRFQIVEAAKMPTDVEAIEAVAKKAGIYTLTGQYLGNASKWNTLPAGIYVVDGVKKVK